MKRYIYIPLVAVMILSLLISGFRSFNKTTDNTDDNSKVLGNTVPLLQMPSK